MDKEQQKRIINASIYILAVLAGLVALTFCFKLAANSIANISLRITVIYVIYLAIIGIVFLACFVEKRKVKELGFSKDNMLVQISIGVTIAILLSFIIGAIPILISGGEFSLIGSKPTSTFNAIFSIITDLIFIGTFEELVFRGYIQTRINELTRFKFIGVLIAAALFGLWHIINGGIIQVAFTFVIGAVFGFCRAYQKNCTLLSVIIAHGLYDALLVVITLVLL